VWDPQSEISKAYKLVLLLGIRLELKSPQAEEELAILLAVPLEPERVKHLELLWELLLERPLVLSSG
jgi:hypothetical protein